MEVLWHGTAAVEIRCAAGRILFDPFVPLPGAGTDARPTLRDYEGFTDIFVTHGHFDHITNLPEIAARSPGVRIHGTAAPCASLRRRGVPAEDLDRIEPGQTIRVNGFAVAAFAGRHAELPRATLRRLGNILRSPCRGNLPLILREHLRSPEKGETLIYRIEADGRSIVLLGSLNLRDNVEYGVGADLLVLPYNGWEDNLPPALRVIERLRPRRVLLDHYDDSFPPLTTPLDLRPILERSPVPAAPAVPGEIVPV